MDARDGAKTRLDLAKDAALRVIDDLPPNSTVQVVTCTDRAVAAGPKSPRNLDQAKLLIQNLQATQQSTDFLGGTDAKPSPRSSRAEGAAKEVYLFSDMQRGGWERQSSAIRAKCEEIKAQGTLFLVRCGTAAGPQRGHRRSQAAVGHPAHRQHGCRSRCIVKNTGTEPVNGLTVTLKVDGQPLDKDAQPIEKLGPGETKPVTLTGKIDQAGWRVLTAEVKPDQLDDDNKFDQVILVRDKVRVLDRRRLAERPRPGEGRQLLPRPRPVAGAGRVQVPVPRPADGREGRGRRARPARRQGSLHPGELPRSAGRGRCRPTSCSGSASSSRKGTAC